MTTVAMDTIREVQTRPEHKRKVKRHMRGDSEDDDDPPIAAAVHSTPAVDSILSETKLGAKQLRIDIIEPKRSNNNRGAGCFTEILADNGKRRIRCDCCLRTAALDKSKNFLSRHKKCGLSKPAPKRRAKAALPAHTVLKEQNVYGIEGHVRRLLTCNRCGGFGSDDSYTRFLRVHEKCVTTGRSKRGHRVLTRQTKSVVEDILGEEVAGQGRKRRKTVLAAVT